MTDTTTCPTCSATLPSGAAFCTSCGNPTSPPPEDVTRVDNPGLHDSTQVFAAPPAPPAPPTGSEPPPPPAAPWQPSAPPAPPAPPAPAATPSWAPPPPGPGAPPPAWGQTPQEPPTQWGAAPAAPPWSASAPAPARSDSATDAGSPLGAIAAGLGGLLTLIGLFTTWFASNNGLETTGWNLASGWALDGGTTLESKDPYALLALGLIALVVAAALFTGKARIVFRIAALAVGAAVIAIMVRDWTSVVDVVQERMADSFEASQKAGFFVGIVGGVLTMVAGLLPAKKA